MARAKKDATLDNRTNRLKVAPRKAPYWTSLAEGEQIGYYRPMSRSAGTWQAKWRDKTTGERRAKALGTADDYEDADGIRIMNWAQAQSRARDWFAEVAREARRKVDGGTVHEGPFTVAAALADYKKDCERRGVKGTQTQTYQVEAHIRPALGDIEVGKLTRKKIEKWLEVLATSPRRVRAKKVPTPDVLGPKPRKFKHPRKPPEPLPPPAPPSTDKERRARKDTANRILTILKAALNYAHTSGAYRGDPIWQEVKPYRNTSTARVRFLAIEDQVRFVRACQPDFQRLSKGALYTGARYGELTKITVAEFNREAKTIFIPGHIAKSGKDRHIFLTEEGTVFFEAVTAGRRADETMFLRDGEVKRRTREGGQVWLHGDQRPSMEVACKAAGIAKLTFHELRHTAASTWIAAGMDLILVARQLGHSDTRMVERHYGHLCPDAAAARFRSIAPALGLEGSERVVSLKIQSS
ncbi:site-specific integrase [Geothrix sp.]|jgi:integrase|uniref:tyrosine-type recombinase/integrase n=1 Tax=Geothrix sp. TaxID=1962974 RepID=UPI0025C47FC8|nr:site-specific integrase [Geothrix sp.]